jgi:hypothetical protein
MRAASYRLTFFSILMLVSSTFVLAQPAGEAGDEVTPPIDACALLQSTQGGCCELNAPSARPDAYHRINDYAVQLDQRLQAGEPLRTRATDGPMLYTRSYSYSIGPHSSSAP